MVVGGLRDRGLKAETLAFDVTDYGAVAAAIQSVVTNHHRLDILIANAGIIHRALLADWTLGAWDDVLAANLKASFFLAKQISLARTSRTFLRPTPYTALSIDLFSAL